MSDAFAEIVVGPDGATELYGALIAAQGEFPNVARTSEGVVGADKTDTDERGKGRSITKKYADLAEVVATVRPILAKHGLGYIQAPTTPAEGVVSTTTRIIHTSGQWIESTITMTAGRTPQQQGIVITYSRRYALVSMLGLATEEDPDGNLDGNQEPRGRAQRRTTQRNADTTPSGRQRTSAAPPSDDVDHWSKLGWENGDVHNAEIEALRARRRALPDAIRADADSFLNGRKPPFARAFATAYARKLDQLETPPEPATEPGPPGEDDSERPFA